FARDRQNPTIDEVLRTIIDRTWGSPTPDDPNHQALRRAVQRVVLNTLLDRAGDARAQPDVRQVIEYHLVALDQRIAGMPDGPLADRALRAAARRDIARYLAGDDEPAKRSRFSVIPLPWP